MATKKAGRNIPKRGKIDIKSTNPEVRQALRHRALLRAEGGPLLRGDVWSNLDWSRAWKKSGKKGTN